MALGIRGRARLLIPSVLCGLGLLATGCDGEKEATPPPSSKAASSPSPASSAPANPYAGRKVKGVLKPGASPDQLQFAPAKLGNTAPGEYDITRTGDYVPVSLLPSAVLETFKLTTGAEVKVVKRKMTAAEFQKSVAGIKENGKRLTGLGAPWEIRFDESGRVAHVYLPPSPSL